MAVLFNVLAAFFFLLGAAIIVRMFRAERRDRARFIRAAAGAFSIAMGNASVLKAPQAALMFFLAGAMLVLTGRRGS